MILFGWCCLGATVLAAPPNIVIILADDMGYSDIGCYGGEIHTPNLDSLGAGGIRFTQFYNTARCCPTRACLLTGLYPHAAGMGHMGKNQGQPGYTGSIHARCSTIAEVLRPAGYATYAVGKWHVTHPISPQGPKDHWPLQRGFDKFYGTITGAGSYYDPTTLCRGNTFLTPLNDPHYHPESYYYTDALSDNAVAYLRAHRQEVSQKPFFLYLAYTAAHWPLHAKPADINKYRGKYSAGYEVIRARRVEKMKGLGLLDPRWKPSKTMGDWTKISNKDWEERCMEVYAAQVDCMDQGVGRVLSEIKASGQWDNTLIFYLQDNGGCAEDLGRSARPLPKDPKARGRDWLQPAITPPMQTRDGRPVRSGPTLMPGPDDSYHSYGEAWANVSNTPFREYKHWVHEGGISSPLIVHWPAGIARMNQPPGKVIKEGIKQATPVHLIDLMATCVEVAGANYPPSGKSEKIPAMAGVSLRPLFSHHGIVPDVLSQRTLFWEHEGNRAVRSGAWKLVAKGPDGPWELYNMEGDRTEQQDLAPREAKRVKEMVQQWEEWAVKNQAIPWPWEPAYRR